MRQRSRQALIISAAAIALAVIANSVINRGICSYYGYQTDRETKYAPFVGCIAKVSGNWVLRSELRAVQ